MSAKYLLLFAVTVALSSAQSDSPLSTILGNITLPSELQGKVDPKDLRAAQNKTLTELKARCEKNGGPDAYFKAQNATEELTQCVNRLVNLSGLPLEIEQAKPNGSVDEVFKKYCDKKPQFETCAKQFTNVTSACLSEGERVHFKTMYNVSLQLVDFICFKEGDRIALFIAEGGQECFQSKQDGLKGCFEKTGYMPTGDVDLASAANVTIRFDEKQCNQMVELQKCVVGVLETCPKPTSANIVDSLFKFIRKATPCNAYEDMDKTEGKSSKAENQKGGATTFYVTSATLVIALVAAVLV